MKAPLRRARGIDIRLRARRRGDVIEVVTPFADISRQVVDLGLVRRELSDWRRDDIRVDIARQGEGQAGPLVRHVSAVLRRWQSVAPGVEQRAAGLPAA